MEEPGATAHSRRWVFDRNRKKLQQARDETVYFACSLEKSTTYALELTFDLIDPAYVSASGRVGKGPTYTRYQTPDGVDFDVRKAG